jgi:ABC-type transport system substrate-binding protein
VARVLRSLGFRTRLHRRPIAELTIPVRRRLQLTVDGDWVADFPAPSAYLPQFFRCGGSLSNGYFCDRALDRRMRQARALQLRDPQRAAALWARIDHELVDEAPWVPLVTLRGVDLVSRRLRNFTFHPVWGFLADQAWVR